MAIRIPYSPDHGKNSQRCPAGHTPCIICGKAVKNGNWWFAVNVWDGGLTLVTAAEAKAAYAANSPETSGDLGAFPIGRDCLKRHPELQPYCQ